MVVKQTITLIKSGANFATWEEAYSQFNDDYDGDLEDDSLSAGVRNSKDESFTLDSPTTFTWIRTWESVDIYLEYVNTREAFFKEKVGAGNLREVALRDWGWEISDDVEPVEE
tara:strand:+ start:586 stop:924 length:339 start_codon:yes stop_codon:yes gene_type:complete